MEVVKKTLLVILQVEFTQQILKNAIFVMQDTILLLQLILYKVFAIYVKIQIVYYVMLIYLTA